MSKPLEVRIFNRLFEKDIYDCVDIKEALYKDLKDGPMNERGHHSNYYKEVRKLIISVIKQEIDKEPTK